MAGPITDFWKELRRRKVFKVAVAYGVVAWLVVQVASTVLPQYDTPAWFLRAFILILALGFPLALVLAWMFDMTPEGLKVESTPTGNKRMLAIAAVLVALAVAWYFGQAKPPELSGGTEGARSIAVLPFVNMSGDPENEYFSDGISEEILNSLAQMPDLKVAARTSSFSFKGLKKEIPDIARELQVRMVLEGSVRKQGQRVRITAQLIDAETGFHVWSQAYDRDLKDIFAIQDEIAHSIADELQVKLGAAHGDGTPRTDTTSLDAYDAYLKGLPLLQERGQDNLIEAERLFRAALALDPRFAKAWAGLALTLTGLPEYSSAPLVATWSKARDAAEYALALEPTLPEPYVVLGYIAGGEFRFATSGALFDRALELAPSSATVYHWYSRVLFYEGDFARSDETALKAVMLDPKDPIMRLNHRNALQSLGRYDEAEAVCDEILVERPGYWLCRGTKFFGAVRRQDYLAARTILRKMSEARGEEAVRFGDALVDALEGKVDSRAVATQLASLPDGIRDPASLTPLSDGGVVLILTTLGHKDLALRRARQLAQAYPHFARAMVLAPQLQALACEPEFQALARELKIDEARAAALCQAGE